MYHSSGRGSVLSTEFSSEKEKKMQIGMELRRSKQIDEALRKKRGDEVKRLTDEEEDAERKRKVI